MDYKHVPVLLREVVEYLAPIEDKSYVDATLGGGGYTREILKHIGQGKILCIDLDTVAIEHARNSMPKTVSFYHGNFSKIDHAVEKAGFTPSGIVADIGLSSYQLDDSDRGFSFQKDEVLDMRFNLSQEKDARFIINHTSPQELVDILKKYGEEKNATAIAKRLCQLPRNIKTTFELNEAVKQGLPNYISNHKLKFQDTLRRVYQAVRIAVNNELGNLEEFLQKSLELL
ncbi:MAG TPA: 16S rRNA (cytosine(1402)-N(4))-methyltransferase RsmH, partial [Patescibacteria group bacterium]|nr:16S rRNA (cytosine(1402)-N(4))-methyltransferase RsmH [Patescibacteria group bacterium]